jgi:hypothetical protein
LLLALSLTAAAAGVSARSWAAEPGKAGYLFLTVGPDARAEGMGGAQTAVADGLSAISYNPASLADARPRDWTLSYTNWVTDIQSGFMAAAIPIGSGLMMAAGIQYFDYGDFDGFDGDGVASGQFGASDFSGALTVAGRVGAPAAWGVTGRFISESIDSESSTGFALDAGARYELGDGRTRVGASIRHLGSQTKALGGGKKDDLPVTGTFGIAHRLRGAPLLAALDIVKPSDDDFGFLGGLEFAGLKPLTLRAGYNSLTGQIETGSGRDDLAGFSIGIGILLRGMMLDYAYGSLSVLGDSHRFGLRSAI